MKKIFIKDDRIGEIEDYKLEQIIKLQKEGKIKGSYSSELSWRKIEIKEFPGYVCQYGWEVTDHEDGWKIDELDDFVITIKKDKKHGNLYFATCEQFFTEFFGNSLMTGGKTFEGVLIKFVKELKAQRKTLCVRGKAIEGKVAEAIYENGLNENERGIMKDKKITAKLLKRAVRLLRKHKVEPPYYLQVENPKEGGDLLYKKINKKGGIL